MHEDSPGRWHRGNSSDRARITAGALSLTVRAFWG